MNLEERLEALEKRVSKIEDTIVPKVTAPNRTTAFDIEGLIVKKIDEIGTQDFIVMALNLKPKQSKSQLKTILENWGKPVGNWFEGGNFNGRLLKKGIVKSDGADANGNDLYILTKRGEQIADELMTKIRSNITER